MDTINHQRIGKNWKSISLNKYVYKDLQKIGDYYRQVRNCFGLLNGEEPEKNKSIPWVIEMLVTEKLCSIHQIEKQDNGRVIWEQMEKKFIRTYNSKRGFNAE